jgi:lipopolysaccharide heptosyltransferase II
MKYIGDVVLTTPIIRSVRARYPEAFIAYLADKEAVSLLHANPFIDEIIPYDFSRPTVLEQPGVALHLRRRKFDAVVDLFGNPRSALLSYLSGAPIRIGGDFGSRGKLFTHRIREDGKPKTAIEFHYQYVKPLDVEPTSWKTEVFLTEDEKRDAGILLKSMGMNLERPIVAIHPGATWPAKIWPSERFAELARSLERTDAQAVLLQGPRDGAVAQQVARLAPASVRMLGVLPVRQLAAVLAHSWVCVANDAAPMHIAVAVGTPTVGIFGPGEEYIWFPYRTPYYEASQSHVALRKDVACHPCHLNVCNRTGDGYMECMRLLSSEEVLHVVEKTLGLSRSSRLGA